MATFSPEMPGSAQDIPSSLNASRGREADRSKAEMIEGAGDFLKVAAKNVDFEFNRASTNEVRDRVEATRDIFIDVDGRTSATKPPPDFDKTKQKWGTIREAYAQGKLPESQYWSLMDSQVRAVKAKYPGYRDEIDKEVSRILGTTPANALVRELRQELTSKKGDHDRILEEAYRHARDSGHPEFRAMVQAGKDPRVLGNVALDRMTSEVKARQLNQTILRDDYTNEQHAQKLTSQHAERYLTARMPEIMQDANSVIKGTTGKDMFQITEELTSRKDPLTPEELDRFRQSVSLVRSKVTQSFEQEMNRTIVVGGKPMSVREAMGGEEKVKAQREFALDQIDNLEKAVADKNFGLLERSKNQFEDLQRQDKKHLYTNSTMIRGYAIAKELMGDTGAATFMLQEGNQAGLAKEWKAYTQHLVGLSLNKEGKTTKDVASSLDAMGNGEAPVKFLIKVQTDMIKDPKAGPDTKARAVNNLFVSDESRDIMANLKTPKDRLNALAEISSPDVAKGVAQADKVRPGLFQKYESWVMNNALVLNKSVIDGAIQSMATIKDPNIKLQYDQGSGTFQVQRTMATGLAFDRQHVDARTLRSVQEDLNKFTLSLMPMYREKHGAQAGTKLMEDAKTLFGVDFSTIKRIEPQKK